MAVNADLSTLLGLVSCPSCRGSLTSGSGLLHCTACGRSFPFDGDVPVLIQSNGFDREPPLLARLQYAILGNPRLYDFHQAHGGGRPIAAQVKKELGGVEGATLLDVGAGTGMVAGLIPPRTRYIWVDSDRLKLRGLLSKPIDCYAVLADAAQLPFGDRAVDWTAMVEVSHHLPDDALGACLAEAARVTRDRFVFVDALRGHRLRSKLLWQFDLGRFPRSEEELIPALEQSFELETVERFRVNHDHVLCVGVPRRGQSTSKAG
jgi:SAM-dependent methyltransferase